MSVDENSNTCLVDKDCAQLGDGYTCDKANGVCVESGEDGDVTPDGDDPVTPSKKKSSGCQTTGASCGIAALLAGLAFAVVAWRRRRA